MFKKRLIPLEEVDERVDAMLNDNDMDEEDECVACADMEIDYVPYVDENGNTRAVYEVLRCKDCGYEYVINMFTSDFETECVAEEMGFRDEDG